MPGPEDDLALLVKAARQVGPIALSFWKAEPKAWDKPDNAGPVTEADLAVNDALQTMLPLSPVRRVSPIRWQLPKGTGSSRRSCICPRWI